MIWLSQVIKEKCWKSAFNIESLGKDREDNKEQNLIYKKRTLKLTYINMCIFYFLFKDSKLNVYQFFTTDKKKTLKNN